MCGPAAPILAVAAAAVTAVGQVTSGIAAKQQGNYEQQVAQQNVNLVRQQQSDAIQRDNQDRVALARKYSQQEGDQQAAMAANGIDTNFGSAKQVSEDTSLLYSEDASRLYSNENSELRGFDIDAENYVAKGQAARMRGDAAFTSSLFSAGGTILGGAQQYAKYQALTKPPTLRYDLTGFS